MKKKKTKIRTHPFDEAMRKLLDETKGQEHIPFKVILDSLADKGKAVLLIFLSFPFCQPLQIPGFSSPFGLILAIVGLSIARHHPIWLPQWLLNKKVSYHALEKIALFATKVLQKLRFLISARWVGLVQNPSLRVIHGIVIMLLGILLALPLPIPLTNVLSAYPLLLFGIAFLDEDGYALILAYILSFLCFGVFAMLVWFGKEGVEALWAHL